MATVLVNGQEIEVADDEQLNGIEVARRAGVEIPHYCWHPGLTVVASCRMCLVESGRRDPDSGEVSLLPKLVPACQTPARDGTVFVTDSEKVINARAMVEEDLLIRHPIDCPICDKAGECALQDYHFKHGRDQRRADIQPFTSRRRDLGDTVTLFVDRCVMCSRCVRFCREISGTSELMVTDRGAHEEIDVFPGFPLSNKLAGNVVDLCPVGALGDRDFLYSQRVWFMKSHPHVCSGCSTGCSIYVEENQDRVYRLKPRENPEINQWWMCDEGRYGFKYLHDARRLTGPREQTENGPQNLEWTDALARLDEGLRGAGRVAAVLSPFLTVEEAYLVAQYVRSLDAEALLISGPIPTVGEDEKFPNGFAIRAEKCPNRNGVETVVSGMSETFVGWDDALTALREANIRGVWFAGGYRDEWCAAETAAEWELLELEFLVVQDLFPSPLLELADLQLPSAAAYERGGSFVNRDQRLQSVDWAVRPPAGVYTEGRLAWRLLEKPGMYRPDEVRAELSRDLIRFAAIAAGVPAHGVDLRVNDLV